MENQKVAIIRLRGANKLKKRIEETLKMLRLYNKNTCIVVSNTDSILGMIKKVKDYITWGEIDEETFKMLLGKRGKIIGNKPLTEEYFKSNAKMDFASFAKEFFALKISIKDIPGLKQYFRLKPPTGGFEKYGLKKPFSMGGSLGYRKEKINGLIRKML